MARLGGPKLKDKHSSQSTLYCSLENCTTMADLLQQVLVTLVTVPGIEWSTSLLLPQTRDTQSLTLQAGVIYKA